MNSIVIVTDSTKNFDWAKAQGFNITVIQSKSSDFAYLRNLGIWHCKGEYIFRIDDDEVVSKEVIDNIKCLEPETQAYNVLVRSKFMGKVVNMWDRLTPRIISRGSAHYIGRVHEHLASRMLVAKDIPGSITNNSYENWSDYWKKALRYTSLEDKKLSVVVFRVFFPLYNYFSKSGYKDGVIGLKITMVSIFYGFLMSCRGIRASTKLPSLDEVDIIIRQKISDIEDDKEREYIQFTLQSLKRGDIPPGSSLKDEISQILSVLL